VIPGVASLSRPLQVDSLFSVFGDTCRPVVGGPFSFPFPFSFVFVGCDFWGSRVQCCQFSLVIPGTGGSHGHLATSFLGRPSTLMVSSLIMGFCDVLAKLQILNRSGCKFCRSFGKHSILRRKSLKVYTFPSLNTTVVLTFCSDLLTVPFFLFLTFIPMMPMLVLSWGRLVVTLLTPRPLCVSLLLFLGFHLWALFSPTHILPIQTHRPIL